MQNKHIEVDDISGLQTLEEIIASSKKEIAKWYETCLEQEDGNINRATKRLVMGVAAGTLSTALQFATELQEKEERGVTVKEMAERICVSPCFLAMIAWVVGEKFLTDDVEVAMPEGGDGCAESSQQ